MPEILNYTFFQNALMGAILVSICSGILGTYIVSRRLVFISGGITHASFGGLGLGFYLGMNPVLMAMAFAVSSAFGVQWLSKRHSVREDSAIAVFWALGMAIGVIFIFLSPGFTPSLTEFLFGNILTITHQDLAYFAAFCVVMIAFTLIYMRQIIYIAFDPEFAKVNRLPVRFIESAMICLIAVAIVLIIRMIGIVLLMSVLTLPQMISSVMVKDYVRIMVLSIFNCMLACFIGLFLSYYLNVPAGACIVFVLVLIFGLGKLIGLFLKKQ